MLSTLGLTIMFVVERLMIYYSYMHPPKLDNAMMERALMLLMVAPLTLCITGAWAFSNREIYHNEVQELDPNAVYPVTNHYFVQFFYVFDCATPLFIFILWMFVYALKRIITKPDPLYWEKTFRQNFKEIRKDLDDDLAIYRSD